MRYSNPFIKARNENIIKDFHKLNETMDYSQAIKILCKQYPDTSDNAIRIVLTGVEKWRECSGCGTRFLRQNKKTRYCPKCFYMAQRPKQKKQIEIEESEFFSWRELKGNPMIQETYANRDTEKHKFRVTIQKHNGVLTMAL